MSNSSTCRQALSLGGRCWELWLRSPSRDGWPQESGLLLWRSVATKCHWVWATHSTHRVQVSLSSAGRTFFPLAGTGQKASGKTEMGSRLPRSFGPGEPTWRARERDEEPSTSPFCEHPYHTPNKEEDGTHLLSTSRQSLHGNNYPKIHS